MQHFQRVHEFTRQIYSQALDTWTCHEHYQSVTEMVACILLTSNHIIFLVDPIWNK